MRKLFLYYSLLSLCFIYMLGCAGNQKKAQNNDLLSRLEFLEEDETPLINYLGAKPREDTTTTQVENLPQEQVVLDDTCECECPGDFMENLKLTIIGTVYADNWMLVQVGVPSGSYSDMELEELQIADSLRAVVASEWQRFASVPAHHDEFSEKVGHFEIAIFIWPDTLIYKNGALAELRDFEPFHREATKFLLLLYESLEECVFHLRHAK